MPPKGRSLEELIACLEGLSTQPHLGEIAKKLLRVAKFVSKSDCPPSEICKLAQDIEVIVGAIPEVHPDRKRLLFDAGFIQSTVDAWRTTGTPISRMILPNYGREWTHRYLYMPSWDRDHIPRIDLIGFPGQDRLEDVSLVDYAWIYHELGHILLHAHGEGFDNHFDVEISTFVSSQKARSLADSDVNRRRAEALLDKLQRLWSPGESAWSREIASDIIALWICGPPFLQAFVEMLDRTNHDPHRIAPSHPPYAVRALALIRASEQLTWSNETIALQGKVDAWKKEPPAGGETNEYVTLTHGDVVKSAASSSIKFCAELGLGACDREKLEAAERLLGAKKTPDFGPELVIAAWLLRQRDSAENYHAWERRVVQELADTITL